MLGNIDYRQLIDYSHPHLRDCELWLKSLPTLRGNYFYDLSSHGRNGTLTNMDPASDWVVGQRGPVLDFDGTDDRVEVADIDALSFGNSTTDRPFSVMAWIRIEGFGGNSTAFPVIAKYDSWNPFRGEYIFVVSSNGAMFCQVLDGATTVRCRQDSASSAVSTGVWHHVAMVYDASGVDEGITLYLDGKVLSSSGFGQDGSYVAMHNNTSPVNIGAELYNGDATFSGFADGQIDDARIYSRDFTAAEIEAIYLDTVGMRYEPINRVGAGLPVMSYYSEATPFIPQLIWYN